MQDQPDVRTRPAAQSSPGTEPAAPPRPSGRARVCAILFTALLVATLLAPVVLDTAPMPGIALVNLGILLSAGFAELIDASNRGFLLAVRLGGIAIALLGILIQVL